MGKVQHQYLRCYHPALPLSGAVVVVVVVLLLLVQMLLLVWRDSATRLDVRVAGI